MEAAFRGKIDSQSQNVSAYLTPSQVTNNLNLDTLDPLVQ